MFITFESRSLLLSKESTFESNNTKQGHNKQISYFRKVPTLKEMIYFGKNFSRFQLHRQLIGTKSRFESVIKLV